MNHHTQSPWTPSSWKTKSISQQAEYPDPEALSHELVQLKLLPPVVTVQEIKLLKEQLIDVYNGKGFILQMGDCAEKFADCSIEAVHHKALFYDLLGNLFSEITKIPSLVIGRMAGQFAKPRSELYETVNGQKIMSFKGENINGFELHDRVPDPKRMTEGYFKSIAVLNCLRQIKDTNTCCPELSDKLQRLNIEIMNNTNEQQCNSQQNLSGLIPGNNYEMKREIFTSHEALLLDFEDTQIREEEDKYYDLSAHFLWIGMRTNDTRGAHVEFFRGLENPIGVKLSKEVASSESSLMDLVQMIKVLNPDNQEGKLILITRFGARYVETALPKILKAVRDADLKVLWIVDGVHGNTQKVGDFKTRKLADVKEEILKTMHVFNDFGTRIHGIHLELTPEEVTECLGGNHFGVNEADLGKNYTSYCDPRLNFSQSVELVVEIAEKLRAYEKGHLESNISLLK